MIIKKIICDHCNKVISEDEPKLMVHGEITFDDGNQSRTMRGRKIDCHYCKQCGYEVLGALFPKVIANRTIFEWTGETNANEVGL